MWVHFMAVWVEYLIFLNVANTTHSLQLPDASRYKGGGVFGWRDVSVVCGVGVLGVGRF